MEVAIDEQQDLLRRVFSLDAVAEDAAGEAMNPASVAADQLGEDLLGLLIGWKVHGGDRTKAPVPYRLWAALAWLNLGSGRVTLA